MRKESRLVVGVATFLLVGSICTAQEVHTVGDGESLQAAIDAAVDADVLLITGTVAGPGLIDGKSLVLQGEGVSPTIGGLQVRNLGPEQSVLLRNLRIVSTPVPEWWSDGYSLVVEFCQGSVWIEDCIVQGGNSPATMIRDSEEVVWVRSTSQGSLNQNWLSGGNHGVDALRSTMHAHECQFAGGIAVPTPGLGGEHVSGGAGVRLRGSFLFASDSLFEGQTSYCGVGLCSLFGFGADGLELTDASGNPSQSFTIDAVVHPDGTIAGDENHTALSAIPCGIVAGSPVREGESVDATLFGTPDSLAFVALSVFPRASFVAPLAGSVLLNEPGFLYLALPLDAQGQAGFSLPFSSIGGAADGLQTFHQAVLLLPTLELQLCSATSVLLLSAAF